MAAGTPSRGVACKTSAAAIRNAARREEMLRLRIEGLTLEEIGQRMGVHKTAVQAAIAKALEKQTQEPSRQLISLELERCDVLWRQAMKTALTYHPLVSGGSVVSGPVLTSDGQPVRDPETGEVRTCVLEDKAPKLAAITTAVRVMERRSKLLGLDAAVKLQQTVTVSEEGGSAYNLKRLSNDETELLNHLLTKASDETVTPDDEQHSASRAAWETVTREELAVMQAVFRKLGVKYLTADTVLGLYVAPQLTAPQP